MRPVIRQDGIDELGCRVNVTMGPLVDGRTIRMVPRPLKHLVRIELCELGRRRVERVDDELALGIQRCEGRPQRGKLTIGRGQVHQRVERKDNQPERAAGRAVCFRHIEFPQRHPIADARVESRCFGPREHDGGVIETGHVEPGLGKRNQDPAAAAAHLQDRVADDIGKAEDQVDVGAKARVFEVVEVGDVLVGVIVDWQGYFHRAILHRTSGQGRGNGSLKEMPSERHHANGAAGDGGRSSALTLVVALSYSRVMATKRSGTVSTPADGDRVVTQNRRAYHDYFIDETIEAGIVLTGSEIKSIRDGKITIGESYVRVDNGELWLIGANVAPYVHGQNGFVDPDPSRPRKLLVHRRQIDDLREATERKGLTLVPVRVRLRRGRAKIEVGIARGKKLYDKRQAVAERDAKRSIEVAMKERRQQ